MMKKTIIITLLILCSVSVMADTYAADKIIDEWFFVEETITAKGDTFTVIYVDEGKEQVNLKSQNGIFYKIYKDSCKRIEDLGFCLQEIEFDEEEDDEKARIEVYDLETVVAVTREITEGTLITGEETTIKVTLDNDGEKDVNIKYIDEFPKGIEVAEADDNAILKNNVVTWEGILKDGEKEEFEYVIRAVEDVDVKLVGRIIYENEVYYTDAINLKSETVLETEFEWEKDPLTLGYQIDMNVTLINNEDDDIDVNNFTIKFPPELRVIKGGKEINEYYWDGLVSQKGKQIGNKTTTGKKTITGFKVTPLNSGISDLTTSLDFDFKDKRNLKTRSIETIETEEPKLYIRITLDEDGKYEYDRDGKVDALQTGKIKIDIQKSNPDINYTNLRINISGSALEEPMYLSLNKLSSVDNERIATIPYTAPDVSKDTTYKIDVVVDFITQYGDEFVEDEDYEIQVKKIRPLDVKYEIDPSSPESGEETIIEVNLENNRQNDAEDVTVCINSNMDEINEICKKINVLADLEKTVHSFKIKAPRVNETKNFFINTTIEYSDEYRNYSYYEEKTIKIKPRELKPKIEMKVDDKDIGIGGEVLIDYRIRNDEEETIKNLVLEFVPSQYFDIIGPLSYYVGNIDPEEELNLYDIHAVRAKKNDTQRIAKTIAKFNDFYFGRMFERNTTQISFKVKDSYFTGPMIIANKTIPSIVNESDYFPVTITLENIGKQSTNVKMFIDGIEYSKNVYAGKTAQIEYEMKLDETGNLIVPKTVISYDYDGDSYTTATNDVKIKVNPKPEPKEEKEQPKQEDETKQIKIPKERKTVIEQIIEFFKNLFTKKEDN